jgi:hypothetical protein
MRDNLQGGDTMELKSTMSRGRKFWNGILEDVLAYHPRSSTRQATVCGGSTSTGDGSDGRERGKMTQLGASLYSRKYNTGLCAYVRGGSDGFEFD